MMAEQQQQNGMVENYGEPGIKSLEEVSEKKNVQLMYRLT